MRNEHRRNWNMAIKLKIMENEKRTRVIWLEKLKNVKKKIHKHFLICNIARNHKNVENEKGTLSDLEYG